ncbi:histidine kinase dimerization/phosphoacceptor domain -containing protein [Henriciella sp. AS95]|uniref:sensor histidine kinase n=1 Tax=Henriciella sp. AS95 TaxID=3135782 RepID=UPI00317246EB
MLSSVEKFKASVLDQLGEGVIVADDKGRIITVNRAAEEIHGRVRLDVPPDEYSETYKLLTMEDEPYPSHELPLARAVLNGETVVDSAWKIKRPDGSVVFAVGTARPVLDDDGRQIGSVLTMRDDTLRLQAEQQLREALYLKEMLLFEVNHRVRNSLQIVSSIVSLPLQRIEDKEARDALRQTRDRVDVVSATHRSLYELGTHDRVDCVKLLPDICQQIFETYQLDRGIKLIRDSRGEIILPISKAVSLCLAVTELLTNACKYAFKERDVGRITLLIDGESDEVMVSVMDDGVGIKDGERDPNGTGVGTLLVEALTSVLGAKVDRETGSSGTRHTISFMREELAGNLRNGMFDPNRSANP